MNTFTPARSFMSDIIFSEGCVGKKLSVLKSNKSPGPDCLHPRVLKELYTVVAKYMQEIFTFSYDNSVLPEEWKLVLCPLFPKKERKT